MEQCIVIARILPQFVRNMQSIAAHVTHTTNAHDVIYVIDFNEFSFSSITEPALLIVRRGLKVLVARNNFGTIIAPRFKLDCAPNSLEQDETIG